jgi:uncharacterized protein YjeT (DUF2065 family)
MKSRTLFSLVIIVAGLLYCLVPLIFPLCPVINGKIMKCFWSGRALMGVGVAVIIGGLLYFFSPSLQRRLGLSLMIGVLSILGGAIPLFLIGVCANEAMPCRSGTLPAWIIVSSFLLLASIIDSKLLSRRIKDERSKGVDV